MSFYILESIYIGSKQYVADLDHIEIVKGSCENLKDYTCNNWSVRYHGTFHTVDLAKKAIKKIFGDDVRDGDEEGLFDSEDDNVVATYKPGVLIEMSIKASADFIYESIKNDVDVNTDDEEIYLLVTEYQQEARGQGYELIGDIEDWIKEYRDELIEEYRDELNDE
jgi:hypothetical protein